MFLIRTEMRRKGTYVTLLKELQWAFPVLKVHLPQNEMFATMIFETAKTTLRAGLIFLSVSQTCLNWHRNGLK